MTPDLSRTGILVRATNDLAQVVRHQRKTQGLTQADLAGLSGTGIRFIVDLEKGKETVEFRKALSVLQALGVEMNLKVKP